MLKNRRKVCFLLAFLMLLSIYNYRLIEKEEAFGIASEEKDEFCINQMSERLSGREPYLGKESVINISEKISQNNESYLSQKKDLRILTSNLYMGCISQDNGKIFVYSEVTEFHKILEGKVIIGFIHRSDGKKGI